MMRALRLAFAALLGALLAFPAQAQKLSELPDATPVLTDKVAGLDDPAGTPATSLFEFGAIRDLFQDNLTGLQVDSGTLTADDPWLFEQTWNEGATTFTGLKVDVTDTASASGSKLLDFHVGGASKFAVTKAGHIEVDGNFSLKNTDATAEIKSSQREVQIVSNGNVLFASRINFGNVFTDTLPFGWVSGLAGGQTPDTQLWRDAADTLALRRDTNAQEQRWWNTFTSLSDGEYGYASWREQANVFEIGTKNAGGTGVNRNMQLAPAGGTTSVVGFLALPDTGELTIATGAVTATGSYHTVDTEGDAASDDLDTISGCTDGHQLVIQAEHTDRTVVAKDGTGNLALAGDFSLDNAEDTLTLLCAGALSAWVETSRSDNGT